MGWASPLLAAAATLVIGFALFSGLGKNPLEAFYVFFVKPVETLYGFGELLLKASPLMLCAVGLAAGYRANVWNIGAEGQLTLGAICGGGVALAFHDMGGAWVLPLMILAGAAGGMAWAAIPAWLRIRFNANEILVSLMLVYVASLLLSLLVHGAWRDPEGFNFPQSKMFNDFALLPNLLAETRLNIGFFLALAAVAIAWVFMTKSLTGFQMRVAGLAPAAANYAGISAKRTVWLGMLIGGATAGLAGVSEIAGPHRTTAAVGVAGLRLRRDHRRLRRSPASVRHPARQPADVAAVPRRRVRADGPRAAVGGDRPVPGHAAVLPARGGRVHQLPPEDRAPPRHCGIGTHAQPGRRIGASMDHLATLFVLTLAAGTPLVFAALGELVVEKSGVLNLGVEGMMLVGAVVAFMVAATTKQPWLGAIAGMAAGAALSIIFGVLTLSLMANQVATGLALSLFGVGLVRVHRPALHQRRHRRHQAARHSRCVGHPLRRQAALFAQSLRLPVAAPVRWDPVFPVPDARRARRARGRRVA